VPRTRFAPVKKCNDLLLLRSDAYACVNSVPVLAEGVSAAPSVSLDSKKYKLVQQLEANLIGGSAPSLKSCSSLTVKGDVRLSSKNVLDEASRNLRVGKGLIDSSTPKLAKKVSQVEELINEYSKRIEITFVSNNETHLDIERFKSFNPFSEFTISVRPGNYIFIAKKPGVQSFRKEVKIKSTDSKKTISVICNLSCSIN